MAPRDRDISDALGELKSFGEKARDDRAEDCNGSVDSSDTASIVAGGKSNLIVVVWDSLCVDGRVSVGGGGMKGFFKWRRLQF